MGQIMKLNLIYYKTLLNDGFNLIVLVEGSPGVGKTSLVVALAEFSGHAVVRINLSEQVMLLCSIFCVLTTLL